MFGDPWSNDLKPLVKKSLLAIRITIVSSICVSASPSWLWLKNKGRGSPSIWCPIVKYISTSRKPTDISRRLFSFGVSLSFSASSSAASLAEALIFSCEAPFTDAPYPASCTARIISADDAVPSTPIEFVSRLTLQESTPGTFDTAFSTLAWHAAQLMPVTIYCSIV